MGKEKAPKKSALCTLLHYLFKYLYMFSLRNKGMLLQIYSVFLQLLKISSLQRMHVSKQTTQTISLV